MSDRSAFYATAILSIVIFFSGFLIVVAIGDCGCCR